jgi:hypothetical protein
MLTDIEVEIKFAPWQSENRNRRAVAFSAAAVALPKSMFGHTGLPI